MDSIPTPPKGALSLTSEDIADLRARGLDENTVREQLARIGQGFPRIELDRPCTVGDGVVRLSTEQRESALEAFEEARDAGRFTRFVPASGAASRMFKSLRAAADGGARAVGETSPGVEPKLEADGVSEADLEATSKFLGSLQEFAFALDLREAAGGVHATEMDAADLLRTMLDPDGLGYAQMPKGKIPFHCYPDGPRNAFQEHLEEATETIRDADGRVRLHFTVPPAHMETIREELHEFAHHLDRATFKLEFSVQSAATDTLAASPEGQPFRDREGRLVFRPGGHGALLENLFKCGGDLVLVRNIDNIAHREWRHPQLDERRVLAGYLVVLERKIGHWLERLAVPGIDDAEIGAIEREYENVFCRTWQAGAETAPLSGEDKGIAVPESAGLGARKARLRGRLERPIRVCGMVRNEGEPGGGPFWVRHPDGTTSIQIVELSQVDTSDESQSAAVVKATHFNPVDLAVSLRRPDGSLYNLAQFVDEETGIVCEKSEAGRPLLALELPGLWNGSMAHWNTVFLEVPIETFTPVKTVLDLLRPPHCPRRADG